MLELKITANSAEEIKRQLIQALNSFHPVTTQETEQLELKFNSQKETAQKVEEKKIETPKEIAKKVIEETKQDVEPKMPKMKAPSLAMKLPQSAEEADEEAAQKTKDTAPTKFSDPADALRRLSGKKGIGTCLKILANFGAKKVSDLNPTDYQGFMDACYNVLVS